MGYFARVLADPIRWLLLVLGGALGALLYRTDQHQYVTDGLGQWWQESE
jgi:hypothetical protein